MVESPAENAIFVERRDRVGRFDGHIFKKQRGTTAHGRSLNDVNRF